KGFRAYGIDLDRLSPEDAAERVRDRAIIETLVMAQEHWAYVRRQAAPDRTEAWGRPLRLARLASPDPVRDRFREALARQDVAGLRELTTDEALGALQVPTLVFVGNLLR